MIDDQMTNSIGPALLTGEIICSVNTSRACNAKRMLDTYLLKIHVAARVELKQAALELQK